MTIDDDTDRPNGHRLPRLITQQGICAELGVGEATAQKIFELVTLIRLPGHRRVFAYRDEVRTLLARFEQQPEVA